MPEEIEARRDIDAAVAVPSCFWLGPLAALALATESITSPPCGVRTPVRAGVDCKVVTSEPRLASRRVGSCRLARQRRG